MGRPGRTFRPLNTMLVLLLVASSASFPVDQRVEDTSWPNTCKGQVQAHLAYNMSGRAEQIPFGGVPNETLADAICCDEDFKPYAEPRGLFAEPDVDLFAHVNKTGLT